MSNMLGKSFTARLLADVKRNGAITVDRRSTQAAQAIRLEGGARSQLFQFDHVAGSTDHYAISVAKTQYDEGGAMFGITDNGLVGIGADVRVPAFWQIRASSQGSLVEKGKITLQTQEGKDIGICWLDEPWGNPFQPDAGDITRVGYLSTAGEAAIELIVFNITQI